MAKLNKNEIEAVANKAQRELEKAAKERIEKLKKEYTPDETASRLFELAKERDKNIDEIAKLDSQSYELKNQISNILREKYDYHGYSYGYDDVFKAVINKKHPLPPVPSKASIIDDITIAAIDRDFDTAKFIEGLVAKFNE